MNTEATIQRIQDSLSEVRADVVTESESEYVRVS